MNGAREAVAALLRTRGCPDYVVAGGLERLVACWERLALGLASAYTLGLDDWLEDMDGRQRIADVITAVPHAADRRLLARVAAADELVRARTRTVDACLWGGQVASAQRLTAEAHWWYWRLPPALQGRGSSTH